MVSGQLPPEENCPPPVKVRVWIKVKVSFRVGNNQTIAPAENLPRLGIVLGLGANFPWGQLL